MMRYFNKLIITVLFGVITLFSTCIFFTGCSSTVEANDICILYTNDVHSATDYKETIDNDVITSIQYGYASLAGAKAQMEEKYGIANVGLVDCGDHLQGEIISTISKGEYIVDIMNEIGYQYATLGNHEFDYGMDKILELAKGENKLSKYTYLSSNFLDKDENPVLKQYEIASYGNVKIGYVGVSTPETLYKSNPAYFKDQNGNYIYDFCSGDDGKKLYENVQASIDNAKSEGADYIVILSHLGIDDESKPYRSTDLIANISGADVVLDAHSHSEIVSQNVRDKDNKIVILSSTGTKLAKIGKLVITSNKDITTTLIDGYRPTEKDKLENNKVYEAYKKADEFIKEINTKFNEKKNEVVAKSSVDLIANDEDGNRIVRNQETNLGNLVADAYRNQFDADIALVNGGGIRGNIYKGDITYENIISVHPFGNYISMVEVTGKQILDALEFSYRIVTKDHPKTGDRLTDALGGFFQISGLRVEIDTSVLSTVETDEVGNFKSIGSNRRITKVEVLQSDGSYKEIDLNKTYKVVSSDYILFNGGDGFTMFKGCKKLAESVKIDNQVLIDYIEMLGGEVPSSYESVEGRILLK